MTTDLEHRFETWLEPFRGVVDELWSSLVGAIEGNARRLLLVSARTGDGSTTIASALALGLAKYYQHDTLLVEANAALPGLANYLDMPSRPGLAQYFRNEIAFDDVVLDTGTDALRIAPWGTDEQSSMGRNQISRMFDDAQRFTDLMIIDGGPILDRPEGRLLLPSVDASIVVCRARRRERDEMEQLSAILKTAPAEFLGGILNRYKQEMPGR